MSALPTAISIMRSTPTRRRPSCSARRRGRAVLLGLAMLMAAPEMGAAAEPDPCPDAVTQLDLNLCWGTRMQALEAAVDAETAALGETLRTDGDRSGADLLAQADAAWRAYGEAHCRLAGEFYAGGSIQPMIVAMCRARLAEARLDALEGLRRE